MGDFTIENTAGNTVFGNYANTRDVFECECTNVVHRAYTEDERLQKKNRPGQLAWTFVVSEGAASGAQESGNQITITKQIPASPEDGMSGFYNAVLAGFDRKLVGKSKLKSADFLGRKVYVEIVQPSNPDLGVRYADVRMSNSAAFNARRSFAEKAPAAQDDTGTVSSDDMVEDYSDE